MCINKHFGHCGDYGQSVEETRFISSRRTPESGMTTDLSILSHNEKYHQLTQLTDFMKLSPSWETASWAGTQKFPQYFMEPEGSLPCSQDPSTGPYPEPDRSSPYHPNLSKIHFKIIPPPTSWSS
jgi:hypothetical protein